MNQATSSTRQSVASNGLRRGDAITGGRFVGDVPNGGSRWVSYGGSRWVSYGGSRWVSYGDEAAFQEMCRTFDRIHSGNSANSTRRRRAAVA